MEFFADLHCHTKYSDGRNTVDEMITAAKNKGLQRLAITDHGPNNIGTGVRNSETYLQIKDEIKESLEAEKGNEQNIEVWVGAEADIIDLAGGIDVPKKIYQQLDWLIIGLHPYSLPTTINGIINLSLYNQLAKVSGNVKERVRNSNTKTLVEALYMHPADCVSHPNLQMAVDIKEVARACTKTDTAYEINTGHSYQQASDIYEVAKEGVNFVVNSDSHYAETLGELDYGAELLEKAGVDSEQVINTLPI